MSEFTPTERSKVRRHPERASYDRELVHAILDQAFVCNVAFVVDGMPYVVPTNYVRDGERLLLQFHFLRLADAVHGGSTVRTSAFTERFGNDRIRELVVPNRA